MTTGTIHTFDPTRGTGTLCCVAGSTVPFSSPDPTLRVGDEVTVQLVGGICGLYATHDILDVRPTPAPVFRSAPALAA